MIFKKRKEIKELKERIEALEARLEERESDDCPKCGMAYIETSQMSGSSKTFLCPRCGNEKKLPWPDLELR